MGKGISLFGRKRMSDLVTEEHSVATAKKDELLALKLQQVNNDAEVAGSLQMLPIDKVQPDQVQPRKTFRNIDSLAASISEKGVIQPVIVSTKDAKGFYRIIAGERRCLASVKAGLQTLPCILRDETDANILILQLLENDQRENVSPLEEADALKKLIGEMALSKSQVAKELGHDAGWVSIRLGLHEASDAIKDLVKAGLVEDIRTLHELRMFEQEDCKNSLKLIERIKHNQVAGSYRDAISKARSLHKQMKVSRKKPASTSRITKIEKIGDELVLHLKGKKRPQQYKIDKAALVSFVAEVTYD